MAFTQNVPGVGFSISYCDDGWIWSNGPGEPALGQVDLQAVATRQIGHALGLGNSTAAGASMGPTLVAAARRSVPSKPTTGRGWRPSTERPPLPSR